MKTLTLSGISFKKDPHALAILLYSLFDIARENDGIITPGELTDVARKLGFIGSINSLSVFLKAEGFISGNVRGSIFIGTTHESTGVAFLRKYEAGMLPRVLSQKERDFILQSTSREAHPTEAAILRVLRLLGVLRQELEQFPSLAHETSFRIAEYETLCLTTEEHIWGIVARIQNLIEEMKWLEVSDISGSDLLTREAYNEAADLRKKMHTDNETLKEYQHTLARAQKNLKTTQLIRDMGETFTKMMDDFLRAETE